jgi:hypothetical protein
LLVVATAYMLDRSHAIVREECRRLCDPVGMDYTIRAVPVNPLDLKYPGECICVPRPARRWWEIWK